MCRTLCLYLLLLLGFIGAKNIFAGVASRSSPRPRIIATTDGEIDDRCSMIRFLLYVNEWEVEGIIYSSSKFHWKGHRWAGETWIQRDIDCYAKVYPLLKQHDPRYPPPGELRKKVFVGNIAKVGDMSEETPGSQRIVEVLLDNKPGPVYLQAWGGTNTIARALKTIETRYPNRKEEVSRKAVIYIILDQDDTFKRYIRPNWPKVRVLGSWRQFAAVAYSWKKLIPGRLHRFFNKQWMASNILEGHGPLCAAYPVKYFLSEGDSPSFMHQIRRGLGSLRHPAYGGWGGRFERDKGPAEVFSNAPDDGNLYKPLWRWAEDFQNDWAARADWCVQPPSKANHNPRAVVNGKKGMEVLRMKVKAGSAVRLSARGSSDPDGDKLSYKWWIYKDPGTYRGSVAIENAKSAEATIRIPPDAAGSTIHVILTLTDTGTPPLSSYRRVVLQVLR